MSDIDEKIFETERLWEETINQRIKSVDELIEYVCDHPDDKWGYTPLISHYSELVERLLTVQTGDMPSQLDEVVEHILVDGAYRGKRIDVPLLHQRTGGWNSEYPDSGYYLNTARHMLGNRILFATLARFERQSFETLFDNQVIALYGTRGLQLPDIIEHWALLSHDEQYNTGVRTGSGELFAAAYRRKFISFDEVASSTALDYATADIRSEKSLRSLRIMSEQGIGGVQLRLGELWEYDRWLQERIDGGDGYLKAADTLRFGIVLGLSRVGLFSAGIRHDIGKRINVEADAPELSFLKSVSTDYLPVIGVDDVGMEAVSSFLVESGIADSFSTFSLSALHRSHQTARCLVSELRQKHPRPDEIKSH